MAVLLTLPALAQQQSRRPRFNPEEFRARMEAYITQKAELTQSDAERVFPIFQEMKNKQFEVMRKVQQQRHRGEEQLKSEEDYERALTTMGEAGIENAKIELIYYKKISKVVSAKKAYRIKLADDAFHREVLQRANNGNNNRNNNNNPNRRPRQ